MLVCSAVGCNDIISEFKTFQQHHQPGVDLLHSQAMFLPKISSKSSQQDKFNNVKAFGDKFNMSRHLGTNLVMSRHLGNKGWRSGESARLPPIWPRFKSRRRRHMWVEFVVDSLLCSERFFSSQSGFPLSSKTNVSKFRFDQESGRRRTTLWMCYLQIIIHYLFYLFIYYIKRKKASLPVDVCGSKIPLHYASCYLVELLVSVQ